VERVGVVRRQESARESRVVVGVALPVLGSGRVEVDGSQEQRRGAVAALRQTALTTRRLLTAAAAAARTHQHLDKSPATSILLPSAGTGYRPVSVCLSVTCRCSLETGGRIALVFGMGASFDLCYTVL